MPDAARALVRPVLLSEPQPSRRQAQAPVAGLPSRSARFRRGSRGPRVEPREASESRTHTAECTPPRAPKPPPREPDVDTGGAGEGESFWSKVKRGLTGGT